MPVIESAGLVSLFQLGNNYTLDSVGGLQGVGPKIKMSGSAIAAGQFGLWTPLGAEFVVTNYQVAWRFGGLDQYVVWAVDSFGNYIGQSALMTGGSFALQTYENGLHQDLNNDGIIGPVTTVLEASGSTTLAKVADAYSFGVGGLVLRVGGTVVTAGQFGAWTPLGAEQVGSGYQLAWQFGTADQYLVWNVNSSGVLVSQSAVMSGISFAWESLETTLQQDLNGDGTTGVTTTVIEANGSTRLVQVANTYAFYPTLVSSGPQLKLSGAAVTVGQFGAWTAIGAAQVGSGYQVVWKFGGADQYIVWTTDSTGNTLSMGAVVSANSATLQFLEPTFQQDFNNNGTLGFPQTVIESSGSTSLVEMGNTYFFGASGPQLKLSGATVMAGQFGAWAVLGAEQVGSGYQLAWKFTGADQYIVWTVDGAGNTLSMGPVVPGLSFAIESLETTFQQDLNGDGTTGPVTTTLEANGSTKLVKVVDTYALFPTSGSSGPQLKMSGVGVTVGQFGAWNPIGAEQLGSGYQVAWRFGTTDQYLVWSTDSSGNYLSQGAAMSGISFTWESLESTLQQDLNGDGTTGVTTAVIEANGSTRLVQVANTFAFYPTVGSSGPQLKMSGVAVTVGQFGDWKPISAAKTVSGYEVAWKFGNADQYIVWNTDSSGNIVSQGAVLVGNSADLKLLEPVFQQDLNNDGSFFATTAIDTSGPTSLSSFSNVYSLSVNGAAGPLLRSGGANVTIGQFAGWTPIGAEQTAGGYEVAWKSTSGAEQYLVWNIDGSGNLVSQSAVVAGGSSTLASLETSFHQDLNGNGTTGTTSTNIESSGTTVLAKVGNSFSLSDSGLAGPLLRYGNDFVTAGQFGAWTPIGAEWTGSGYAVAWKFGSADQYQVWVTDSTGNYVSSTPASFGSSSALEGYESGFHQDLNSDGLIGVPPSLFTIDVSYSGASTYQSYFTQAALRWQQVITGDLPGFNVPGYGFVDDLHITASVGTIDGRGGILGQTSVEYYRSAGGQPITAFMTFDSADLATMAANGTLPYVILHEMGHALGLGQGIWNYDNLTNGTSFLGAHAAYAYQLMGGFGNVPLETGGGGGTAGSHWSESVFGSELMTGFISGVPDPLSTVTVGALQDMGYVVNYSAADPYTLGQRLVDGGASVSTGTPTGTGTSALVAGGDGLAKFDLADSPVLMTDYDATTISEVDGLGSLVSGSAPAVLSDASGSGGASAGGLQLLTNYMASTLIVPPDQGTGSLQAAPLSYDTLLAHPTA